MGQPKIQGPEQSVPSDPTSVYIGRNTCNVAEAQAKFKTGASDE